MINLANVYHQRLATGNLRLDAAQESALVVLQAFVDSLNNTPPPSFPRKRESSGAKPAPDLIRGLRAKVSSAANASGWIPAFAGMTKLFRKPSPPSPQGLYLYGDVGRGKSMLMDLFFGAVTMPRKRRVHFHQFMLEIHERLHRLQNQQQPDILPRVAGDIAAETRLLCFDEFHVGNIADAMILGRLFEALFAAGVVIVATTNWAPDDLYKNGLQRERFLPFIDMIKTRMIVYRLDGAVDHRFEQTRALPCYFHPLNETHSQKLQEIFFRLTDNAEPEILTLPVQGREVRITHAAKGVGFFNFDELCTTAMGAAYYLAIAQCLHTILIDGIPRMAEEKRNETMRFMNLVDVLYEAKVQLYLAAAAPPEKLAPTGELSFQFQRTVSRLMEMQGRDYRQKGHLQT